MANARLLLPTPRNTSANEAEKQAVVAAVVTDVVDDVLQRCVIAPCCVQTD